jgi:hypothetical protein
MAFTDPNLLVGLPRLAFRYTFAYAGSAMAFGIQERKQFVVECKRCRRDVPAGVQDFPFQSRVPLLARRL